MGNIDNLATVIGGFATALGVLVTLYAIWRESRESRFALNTELLLKLYEQFDGNPMRAERKNAASALLEIEKSGKTELLKVNSLERILNFFELLGLLHKRGAIDESSVRVMFSYWYRLYWQAVTTPLHSDQLSYITSARKDNTAIWQHAQDLASVLINKSTTFDLQELKTFLADETQLKVGAS
jgi:hypothetical protein